MQIINVIYIKDTASKSNLFPKFIKLKTIEFMFYESTRKKKLYEVLYHFSSNFT